MSRQRPPALSGIILLIVLLVYIAAGATVYHFVEHLAWLDAFLFAVVTSATVGYGNVTPHTGPGKVFTIFYILGSVILVSIFVNHVATRTKKANLFSRFFSESDKDTQ